MSEELVKKAINCFGEVWPSDSIALGVCIRDHGKNMVGDIDFLYAGFDRNLWHRFCNEIEFKHYVDNLKPLKNADMPAMPINTMKSVGELSVATNEHMGLSKREYFAAMFMAAWINHHGSAGGYDYSSQAAAKSAIDDADALLEELSK